MASLFSTAFFFILAVTNSTAVASKEFKVGDSEGWRNPGANDTAFYGSWAARNRLVVGDSLREFSVLFSLTLLVKINLFWQVSTYFYDI